MGRIINRLNQQYKLQGRFAVKKVSLLLALIAAMCCFAVTGMAAEQQKLPEGFIAISESKMNWADAKAWCQQQGGRLPLVGGMEKWDYTNWRGIPVDGFGKQGRPWAEVGLSGGFSFFWTGTEDTRASSSVNIILESGGKVSIGNSSPSSANSVVCVPK